MKLTTVILIFSLLQVCAKSSAQLVTIKKENISLREVFTEIRKQTGYTVLVRWNQLKNVAPVNLDMQNVPLQKLLNSVLTDRGFEYIIDDKSIVIKERQKPSLFDRALTLFTDIDIRGRVVDANGRPLPGATVKLKDDKKSVMTDIDGKFFMRGVSEDAVLVISFLGYQPREVRAGSDLNQIVLDDEISKLDEVQVIAYGTVKRREGTGSVVKVEGETLSQAPVSNPLLALQSRVAGLNITQNSGVSGAAVNIQLRGRTQVDKTYGADDSPLFIIDGIPMAAGNSVLTQLGSAISGVGGTGSGLSPFSTISTSDIESIEVLKDADATSIYGSRGANGVILITTKKGKAGTTRINLRGIAGISKAYIPHLLDTRQYLTMRKEAFKNDGIAMNTTNAYDLLLWDTTRTTNVADLLLGGTAHNSNVNASISGGGPLVTYLLSGTFNRETNVFPQPVPNTRGTGHFDLNARSANEKFSANFSATYSSGNNRSPGKDLSSGLLLAPYYKLYNDDGSLSWNDGGIKVTNPLAYTKQTYSAKSTNLTASIMLGYQILPALAFRISGGYNTIHTDELKNYPKTSINPLDNTNAYSQFGNSQFKSWITEPQLEYKRKLGKTTVDLLAGGTLQKQGTDGYQFTINDYTSDDFVGTLIGISSSSFTNASSYDNEYKYAAMFGRVTINYDETYFLNISGRRDGSSRFGPNYSYSSFAAVGAAWIFTEKLIPQNKVLTFGKIRGSYGSSGNDKIGDYQYLARYSTNLFGPTYSDSLALSPTSLFKPDLHWEMNKKLEVALDLGFWKNRFVLTSAWYRNRSNDPLVSYPLPLITGFANVTSNLSGVVVQNKGFELSLDSRNIVRPKFEWRSSFNISFPQNKLIKFPGLEQTSYAKDYVIGRNLDLVYLANFLGVDPATGLYHVEDLNNSGKLEIKNQEGDLTPQFDTEPSYFGGVQNDFRYHNFALSVFINFNKQWTKNWRLVNGSTSVGTASNAPEYVMSRWQKDGDITDVQKFTTIGSSSTSLTGAYAAYVSRSLYENTFFARLQTVELSYNLPSSLMKRTGMAGANIFLQGQNLHTWTSFKDGDPETANINVLAPMRTFVIGFQLGF